MLAVIETVSEDEKEICIANEEWIAEDGLLWPPKNQKHLKQSKFLNLVPGKNWLKIKNFTILKRGINSIEDANERLNFYCVYENTLDKIQQDAEKILQRKHPVLYNENHLDYNDVYDDLSKKKGSTSTPNESLVVPTTKQKSGKYELKCFLCGSLEGSIKCDPCFSEILCVRCDLVYHKHPLRKHHIRQKIETPSVVAKNILEHKNKDQPNTVRKPATVTRIANSDETEKYMFQPLDRANIKKLKPCKSKLSSDAKLQPGITSSGSTQAIQMDDHNSQVLPPLVPIQRRLEKGSASKAPGGSVIKNKVNENGGEEIMLPRYEENRRQNLDIILKREKELQALSGDANIIPENNATVTTKKQVITYAKRKHVRGKEDELLKSEEMHTVQIKHSGSSNVGLIAGNSKMPNKVTCIESILICLICGSTGQIKCDACSSLIFCTQCDFQFHTHPLRTEHKRQKIEPLPPVGNEIVLMVHSETTEQTESATLPETLPQTNLPTGQQKRPVPPLQFIPRKPSLINIRENDGNEEMKNEEICNSSGSSHEDDQVSRLDQDQDSNREISNLESNTSDIIGSKIQSKGGRSQKYESRRIANARARARGRTTPTASNAFNKQVLSRILASIKAIKKSQDKMLVSINDIKRHQVGLKSRLIRANAEIVNMKELLNNNLQKKKEPIPIDMSFVVPKLPISTTIRTHALERSCRDITYCNQLAVRFTKLTASDTKDISTAVKRIMEHIFTYDLLMLYSWTGKSELNGVNDKEQFSSLTGIQSLISKAATLKLPASSTTDNICTKSIKDVVRRATQTWSRQNRL